MVAQACQGLGEAAPLNSEEHGLQSLPLVVNTVRCVALQGTPEVLMAEVLCAPLFSVLRAAREVCLGLCGTRPPGLACVLFKCFCT